tara:strand:+ start:201 stop:479 length:279 start_codon:yes stop_codon:yes gene_type:complete
MNKFLCTVVLDNQINEIKTYANSIFEVFDNLVCMDGVLDIVSVTNIETQETFQFDGDLNSLRRMRDLIEDESLILNKIDELNLDDDTKSQLN